MAGVPAGRLSIEIVAEIARLQQDLDKAKRAVNAASRDIAGSARAANDNLRNIGAGAGKNIVQFSNEVARLKARVDPAWAALQRYKQEVYLLSQAYREGAITQAQYTKELIASRTTFQQAGKAIVGTTGAMQAGFQQAGFQVSDFFVQVGGGTSAIRAASQQLPQLTQAISLMGMGADATGGKFAAFAKFMSGPWGIAITVGASLLGVLAGALLSSDDAAKKSEDSLKDLEQQFDFTAMSAKELAEVNQLLADSNREVERTSIGAANAARINAEANSHAALAAMQRAKAEYERIAAFALDPTFAEGNLAYAGQLGNLEGKITDLQTKIDGFDQQVRRNTFNVEVWTAALDDNGRKAEALRTRINDLRVSFETTGEAGFLREALRLQGQLSELESSTTRKKRERISDAAREYKKLFEETENYIEALQRETEKLTLNDKALRDLEMSRAIEKAQTNDQVAAIIRETAARDQAIAAKEREKQLDDARQKTRNISQVVEALRREAQVLELTGWAREKRLMQMEREVDLAPLQIAQALAYASGQRQIAEEIQRQIDLINEKYGLDIQMGDRVEAWEEEERAIKRVNDQLRDMVQMIGGPLGGFIGGLLSGNFSGLGAPGQLLNILLTPQADLAKQVDVLAQSLDKAFGIGGTFGKVLATGLQGAAIGSIAAQTVFGQGGTNAGASIGGALGQVAGAAIGKAVGGAIGSALGPIGAIAGSLLGNLVGGLFGGTSKGVIGITGGANGLTTFGTKHGSAEQLAAATQAATGMFDALGNIARELGGTLNAGAAGRLSLGMRDDDWVLDPTGQGRTKGAGVINFGPDQEAAVKAAMKLLIDRGVIGGIRESTQRLLSNASDLEQGLQDALAFEGVFKALEAQANPFASALRQLGQEMEYLEGVFQRAGATAEEYAQLQEFIAMQQQALIDQASANYRSTFYTDAENVAFAKQTISSTLTPLGYGNVDTVAEYKALVEATDALADPELYGTLMELSDEFGVLKDAADQAKAAAAAEAAQKKAEAEARKNAFENELRAAWQRERGELERLADSYRSHAENLRDWRLELIAGSDATLGYQQRLAKLRDTFQMARLGDEKALQALPGAGNDFLSAARGQATSLVDYQRAVGMVARMAEDAARTADGMATDAEKQIALLDKQVGKLIDIDQGIKTVAELLGGSGGGNNRGSALRQQRQYERIQRMQERNPNSRGLDRMIERYEAKYGSIDTPLESGGGDMAEVISSLNGRLERQQRTLDRMDQRWERMTANDGVGIIIRNDPDIPLNTVAA